MVTTNTSVKLSVKIEPSKYISNAPSRKAKKKNAATGWLCGTESISKLLVSSPGLCISIPWLFKIFSDGIVPGLWIHIATCIAWSVVGSCLQIIWLYSCISLQQVHPALVGLCKYRSSTVRCRTLFDSTSQDLPLLQLLPTTCVCVNWRNVNSMKSARAFLRHSTSCLDHYSLYLETWQ